MCQFFEGVVEQVEVATGQSILMGYSQGGGMAYRCGLCRADTFAGLVALSASWPDPKALEDRLPEERTQPIFIAHGLSDPLISADTARNANKFLGEAGYTPEYHEYNMAHEISGEGIRDLVPWMANVLPPLA